ncbi:MAG: WXG100 family type VII secretion target [Canibacter sp.]
MNIRVSFAELEQAAGTLGAGRADITARLHALQSQIENLVSSGFVTDQASTRFHDSYLRYTSSTTAVIEQLTEIEAFLRETSRAMQELDQSIASRLG